MARQRGKKWQADVRLLDGTRSRPTFDTRTAAEAWETAARLAVEEGRPVPPVKAAHQSPGRAQRNLATLGPLFDHVSRTEWRALRSAETALRNGQDVVDYFGANRDVGSITSADIADAKVHFASLGLAPATVNRKIAALSKMLKVAHDAGVIGAVPVIRWNVEEQTRFRYLDDKEERVLLAYWLAMGDRDLHDLTILLIDTGARCFSEMLPIRWDAFGPKFSSVTFWHTKTNKPRTVPLTKRCREILAERKRTKGNHLGPFSGVSHGGRVEGAINEHTMRHKWDAMRAATGLHDVTPHTLRHTCCTRLVLGGVDVKRVMTWMGHASITTTMRYMQIRPSALEDVLHILESAPAA